MPAVRAAAATSTTSQRRIVLLAPGRSGSTLLQSVFLTACDDALTFFEPCRHSPLGDVRKQECARQVHRFLRCDLPSRNGRWEPKNIRPWLQHPYRAANGSSTCPMPPFASVGACSRACSAAKLVLVKEIRLVGQLATLVSELRRAAPDRGAVVPTTIIHLVRDPRPMLASQIKLHWWRNEYGRFTAGELEKVARKQCEGMIADGEAGAALIRDGSGGAPGGGPAGSELSYVLVRFEELVANTSQVAQQLYARLGMPVPVSTLAWLKRTTRGTCVNAASHQPAFENYEYGTCRNASARKRAKSRGGGRGGWKHTLTRRQKRIIQRQCGGALRSFGYDLRVDRGGEFVHRIAETRI